MLIASKTDLTTTLSAAEFNQMLTEFATNFIPSSAQTASASVLDQIAKAVAAYAAQGSVFCTDSGAADAYVLTVISPFIAPPTLVDGMAVRFRAGNVNTGASDVTVFGSTISIKKADGTTALSAGDISADVDTILRYDLANTAFILPNDTSPIEVTNLVINGQGSIVQRGDTYDSTTTILNNDDTYLLDRMLLLSDGNDIVDINRETTVVPTGSYSAIKFDQETANKQWAYCQIIENKNAASIIGGVASLSFKARIGGSNATLGTLRAAVISWDSTADTVTSDVIATWAGAGTNPTLATNWTYENTPSNLTLTTSYETFKIENISIDTASATNVAVLIWCDDTDATIGDLAYITDIKLEKGSVSTPFLARLFSEETALCQRYCQKIFGGIGPAATSTIISFAFSLPVTMFSDPSGVITDTTIEVTKPAVASQISSGATFNSNRMGVNGGYLSVAGFTGLTAQDTWSVNQKSTWGLLEAEL